MDDIKLITKYMEPKETYKNDINKRSNYTKFCEIGPVCQWTNEPLKYYLVDDLQNKKVLSVTAGGDHILHTILSGATDITAFDINRFSKYFVDLKMTMVKKYDYSTFWKMANVLSQDGIKNINTLNPVIKTLSDTHQQFFEAIEKRFYDIRNNEKLTYWLGMHLMMEYSYGNIRKYAYGEFDKYLLLQEKINNVNLKYIDYTLEELPSKLKNKYDVIYASNIIGRMAYPSDALYVINDLYYILNENGIIYDYALDLDDGFNYELKKENTNYKDVLPYYDVSCDELSDSILSCGVVYKYKKIERK